jgi:phage-related baseplate assembly protein
MAEIKTRDRLVTELRTFLKAYNRAIDTGDNSLAKDIVLTPYSVGGKAVMDQVAIARDLTILSRLTGTDLDNEATNYRLERLTGTYATVTIVFYATNTPTAEITVPAGTQLSTSGTSFTAPLTFSVLSDARFSASDAPAYYNFDRDRYEFSVSAVCDQRGSIGNVSANLVNRLLSAISGVQGVTNLTASIGGTDQESDDDLRKRIQAAKLGRDLNTVYGLKNYMMSLGFRDAYPIRLEASDAERAIGIDVFVVSTASSAVSQTIFYDPAQVTYNLSYKPVLLVTSVTGSILGTLSNTQYSVNIDETSEYRRSTEANDSITITPGTPLLVGETISIVYTYAAAVTQAQTTLELDENYVLTADVLIKNAIPAYLYMSATLNFKANADAPTTREQCRNALSSYLATYRLGDDIQKSDFIIVLQEGYGDYPVTDVDSVMITNYYLQDSLGNVYTSVNDVISVDNKHYVVYGSATIT